MTIRAKVEDIEKGEWVAEWSSGLSDHFKGTWNWSYLAFESQ